MKQLFTIMMIALAVNLQAQQKSQLYKEESKDLDRVTALMKEKCHSYQFALDWVKVKYEATDPRRQKFEDEIQRKFLKECKNKDIDKYEQEARLNYEQK